MPFPSSHTILYKLFHYTFLKAKLKPNDWPVIYLQTRNDKKNIIACCYLNENDEIEIQMIDTNKGIEKKEKCIKDGSELKEDDRQVSFELKEDEREEKLNELVKDLGIEGVHKENEKHEDGKSEDSEENEEEEKHQESKEDESEEVHKEDKCEDLHREDVKSINVEDESMHKENNESINNANNEDKANINKDSTSDTEHKDINKDSTNDTLHKDSIEDNMNDRALKKDSIQNSTNTANNTNKQSLYKQKKAILFLHDRNQTRYDNTEFISSLKSLNYTILIPDISGFADTKSKFSFPRSINDIQRCLDFLSSFDVTIIGSGFGAFLVINYASTFYDYKTVLINPITFTHYYTSLFESHTINLEHFVSEKTIVFCVGQEESMKIGGKIGCKIYRSESDSVKSLLCNEEVVRKIDEFMQEE